MTESHNSENVMQRMISENQRDSWLPESEGATANDGEQLRTTENNENVERDGPKARGERESRKTRVKSATDRNRYPLIAEFVNSFEKHG